MPALSPRWVIAVSQLPRWPIVILTASSAAAGAASVAIAIAAAASPTTRFMCRSPSLRLSGSFYAFEATQPADQRVGADRQHEQDDQHGIHARHVEGAVRIDDQKADALVRQFGFGQ